MTQNIQWMKYTILVAAVLFSTSCKKYDGDSYNFSNSREDYVRFSPGQALEFNSGMVDTVIDGEDYFYYVRDTSSFRIECRQVNTEVINVDYQIEATESGNSVQLSTSIVSQTNNTIVAVSFPEELLGDADSVVTGTVSLVGAMSNNKNYALGYPLSTDNVSIDFIAYRPNVLYKK